MNPPVASTIESLRAVYLFLFSGVAFDFEVPDSKKELGKTTYLTILLMIAFLISSFIIGLGGRILGIPDIRVRMGLSLTFFGFVFVAIVIYQNLVRKWG